MRKLSWCVGLLLLLGGAVALPAQASAPKCWEALPTASYDVTQMTATYSVPLTPCLRRGHLVTLALSLAITRCQPVLGCEFPINGWKQCRGTRGSCVLVVRAPHAAVEVANYYVSAHLTAVSGDNVDQSSVDRINGLPCVSAGVTARC